MRSCSPSSREGTHFHSLSIHLWRYLQCDSHHLGGLHTACSPSWHVTSTKDFEGVPRRQIYGSSDKGQSTAVQHFDPLCIIQRMEPLNDSMFKLEVTPLPQQSHLQQVAQDHAQVPLEDLQGEDSTTYMMQCSRISNLDLRFQHLLFAKAQLAFIHRRPLKGMYKSQNHLELEGTFKSYLAQFTCNEQGHLTLFIPPLITVPTVQVRRMGSLPRARNLCSCSPSSYPDLLPCQSEPIVISSYTKL